MKRRTRIRKDKTYFLGWRGPKVREFTWPHMGIHDGCWKLITNKELNRTELYDLQDDWPEKKEVSVDYPEVVEELTKKLYAWKESLPVVPNKSCISKSR